MSTDSAEQWRAAYRRALDDIRQVAEQVDAEMPRKRYPLARRLWWRVFGVPEDVRLAQLAERKRRANLHLAGLHGLERTYNQSHPSP